MNGLTADFPVNRAPTVGARVLVEPHDDSRAYLETKRRKMGHLAGAPGKSGR